MLMKLHAVQIGSVVLPTGNEGLKLVSLTSYATWGSPAAATAAPWSLSIGLQRTRKGPWHRSYTIANPELIFGGGSDAYLTIKGLLPDGKAIAITCST